MIRVVSVNVARASLRRIGEAQVLTAIGKRPVDGRWRCAPWGWPATNRPT